MVFLVRLRVQSGVKRLVFPGPTSTWYDLKQQIADVCNIPIEQQKLSRTPLNQPTYITTTDTTTLQQLQINHGDLLYLLEPQTSSSNSATSNKASTASSSVPASGVIPESTAHIPAHRLTKDCNHGPRGACPYCMRGSEDTVKTGVCNHGAGVVCIHCSAHVKSGSKETATWLCNHPDTVFCPLCIPKTSMDDGRSETMSCHCDASKGQECIKCVKKAPVIKVDKIPFSRYLDEKKALCKYKHGPNVTCAFCATPPFPSFLAKANCDRGHAPYPLAVCLNCAPPNANLRVQPYRHCDSISVEGKLLAPFYSSWLNSADKTKPRCAMLFGRYVPEPASTNNPGAIRAEVHALYEPPLDFKASTPIQPFRFLKDDKEKLVHSLASQLGLECVGWVITAGARLGGDKYGGKILMSGPEVEQAARFQARYASTQGYSRFVTLILEQPAQSTQQIEPIAYQVADTCVALEQAHVFDAANDPYLLSTRIPKKHELLPTIIYKDRPLQPGDPFLPDEMIVKVIVSAPKHSLTMFHHADCPSQGNSELLIKTYMQQHHSEDYEQRLNDFNLLIHMGKVLGEPIINKVCQALKDKQAMSANVRAELDRLLLEKNLL